LLALLGAHPILHISRIRVKILPAVLHRYGTWFLTPREEPRVKVIANRVLRVVFGSKVWGGSGMTQETV